MEKRISRAVTEADQGMRLEQFLRARMHMTKNEISRAKFLENGICVNGRRRKVNAQLETGDRVEVLLETGERKSQRVESSRGGIRVLYEDADVLVVDKPSGLSVHPNGSREADTLANRLAFYLREKGEDSVIRIFGRLDKDTSGVVLAVKNRGAAVRLERQREAGVLFKQYLAVVEGIPEPGQGRIVKPLGPDPKKRNKMRIDPEGKRAVTEYTLLGEVCLSRRGMDWGIPKEGIMPDSRERHCALIRLQLETGRTHQIRVHMASLGCPLLGDPLYGSGPVPEMGRTALHARSIRFLQPFTGEEVWVEAPVPKDIESLLLEHPILAGCFYALPTAGNVC